MVIGFLWTVKRGRMAKYVTCESREALDSTRESRRELFFPQVLRFFSSFLSYALFVAS
jgi:hypothetical protein